MPSGLAPEIELNTETPYWAWRYPRPAAYSRDDNILLGAALTETSEWLVYYEGTVQPEVDVPAWTEHMSGIISHGPASGIFTIIDNLPLGWLYYHVPLVELNNYLGTVVETRIRISSDSGATNQGACIGIFDGAYQFVVWLRHDGVNIDGEPDVPLDMNHWRRVRLEAQGTTCELFVDGTSRQTGPFMNTTTEEKIVFGSFVQL